MSGAATILSPDALAAADPAGMLADVLAQPQQLSDALWRVDSAGVPRRELPGGLAVCGMGGSAIGGDLAAAAIGNRARRPLRAIRDYSLEPWADRDTLVLCASYSGYTEETLACFDAVGEAGGPRVAMTTGGALAERAREQGVPVIGVPAGMRPRAAVVYMTVGALECAARCGAAPSLHDEIEEAQVLLDGLVSEWGPPAGLDSEAKALAVALHGTLPVVHGADATASVAVRWKTQLNENAKLPAFASQLPEADHNEICGWERGREAAPFAAVFLEDADQHERTQRRIELTAREIAATGAPVRRVRSRGRSRLERVLSMVLLGDLVSIYVAALEGIDPTPVDAIDRLKAELWLTARLPTA